MKGTRRIAGLIAVVCAAGECASAQSVPKQPKSLAKLELTAEVATTTDDGNPTRLCREFRSIWIRLRPGEFMTTSPSLRDETRGFGPGILEYWAVYFPPWVGPKDAADVLKPATLFRPKC